MIERLFPRNEGIGDRVLRFVIGAGLASTMVLAPDATWPWAAAAVGGILMVTGLVGTCPIYTALGLSSKSAQG